MTSHPEPDLAQLAERLAHVEARLTEMENHGLRTPFRIRNNAGQVVFEVQSDEDGPHITIFDRTGKPRLFLLVMEDRTDLTLFSPLGPVPASERAMCVFHVDADGACLVTQSANGRRVTVGSVDGREVLSIGARDEMDVGFQVTAEESAMTVGQANGSRRVGIEVSANRARLVLCDGDLKPGLALDFGKDLGCALLAGVPEGQTTPNGLLLHLDRAQQVVHLKERVGTTVRTITSLDLAGHNEPSERTAE